MMIYRESSWVEVAFRGNSMWTFQAIVEKWSKNYITTKVHSFSWIYLYDSSGWIYLTNLSGKITHRLRFTSLGDPATGRWQRFLTHRCSVKKKLQNKMTGPWCFDVFIQIVFLDTWDISSIYQAWSYVLCIVDHYHDRYLQKTCSGITVTFIFGQGMNQDNNTWNTSNFPQPVNFSWSKYKIIKENTPIITN